jgi:hypothetical protein
MVDCDDTALGFRAFGTAHLLTASALHSWGHTFFLRGKGPQVPACPTSRSWSIVDDVDVNVVRSGSIAAWALSLRGRSASWGHTFDLRFLNAAASSQRLGRSSIEQNRTRKALLFHGFSAV